MSSEQFLTLKSGVENYILGPSPVHPPTLSLTGVGYEYVRCRFDDRDDTVYIHQLCAVADGADPHDVFSEGYSVYHVCPIPWLNTPENVEVVAQWGHHERTVRDEPPVSEVRD